MAPTAKELRQAILAQRKALGSTEVDRLSARTVARFFEVSGLSPSSFQGLKLGLYQALPGEFSLYSLETVLEPVGARLHFPRVLPGRPGEMELVEVPPGPALQSLEAAEKEHEAWKLGPYGISEPHPRLPAADPGSLDLVFVPGVAFGLQGERLGMGAGYYDRFLARVPALVRVVLAFDFQLQPRLDQQPWDQPMDCVITERREVVNSRALALFSRLRAG